MAIDQERGDALYAQALKTNSAIPDVVVGPKSFAQAEVFVDALLSNNQFVNPGSTMTDNSTSRPATSLRAFSTQIENILDEFNRSGKGLQFIMSQTALHALNLIGTVPNFAMLTSGAPGAGGIFTNSIGIGLAAANPVTTSKPDRLADLYKGDVIDVIPEAGIPPVRVEGPKLRMPDDQGEGVTLEKLANQLNLYNANSTLSDFTTFDPYADINVTLENIDGVDIKKPDYSAMFTPRPAGPGFSKARAGANFFQPLREGVKDISSLYARQRGAQRNKDTYFSAEDLAEGTVDLAAKDGLEERSVVPFYFEDLRRPERYLFFRAFLDSFSEKFEPDWNVEKFYGRVDPVGTYMNTSRTFDIQFKIAAMSQKGLSAMWRKINTFLKMIYPTYVGGNLHAAPVVRLRVGDVCADQSGRGLPGWIMSPSIDYSNSTWEIGAFDGPKPDEIGKVPQIATIQFGFQVIHETQPHVDADYNFDTRNFRRMGSLISDNTEAAGDSQTQSESERMEQQDVDGTQPGGSDTGVPDRGI